jgi:hypothetical protein
MISKNPVKICGRGLMSSMMNSNNLEFDFVSNLDIKEKVKKPYVTQKRIEVANLLAIAKRYKFRYKPVTIDLNKDIDEVKRLTNGSCIRPDLYLNNNNTCVKCSVYENCCVKSKNLGKRRKRKIN